MKGKSHRKIVLEYEERIKMLEELHRKTLKEVTAYYLEKIKVLEEKI